jgi:hypothetical protein
MVVGCNLAIVDALTLVRKKLETHFVENEHSKNRDIVVPLGW